MDERFADSQWCALLGLMERVVAGNPFQRERLCAQSGRLPEAWEAFFRQVPFTTKSELVADQFAHPPDGTNLTASRDQYIRFCQTSGTTGVSLRVWDTASSWDWLLGNWERGYAWAGVQPGMTVYFAFSFGPFLGFWTAFESAARCGMRVIPGGGLGSRARVYALWEHRAEVLCCTPTYALHLAEAARAAGVDIASSPVRKILVAGEPGGSVPAVREHLERAWPGAEILDHYGMTETGPVAFAVSGKNAGLRVLEDRYYAEVIATDSSNPVGEGELGELVLTPLGRADWPLFRYRTGDLVRARRGAEGALWLEGGILGRVDDMRVVRGVNVYPSAVDALVRSIPGAGEYRVQISARGAMTEMRLELEADPSAALELEGLFERALSLRIPVQAVPVGTLPRFEMKARRWVES
jgi:phenylacetate-CoA ligase